MTWKILQGDNRDTLKTLADNSIDAIVTDPPYGIDFLGKSWDANTGALETYQECLRVLKPGGHILAFSAARTYHHLAVTLEQAGFEIRDQIMWIYSSGFPKSQDVGRQLHKKAHGKPDKQRFNKDEMEIHYSPGGGSNGFGRLAFSETEPAKNAQTTMWRHKVNGKIYKALPDINGDRLAVSHEGEKYGTVYEEVIEVDNEWSGWGTQLKPAHEPIALARKPMKGSIKDNVVKWGTGAINIDATRIPYEDQKDIRMFNGETGFKAVKREVTVEQDLPELGRFPSNVVGEILQEDYQKYFYCPKVSRKERNIGCIDPGPQFQVPNGFDYRMPSINNANGGQSQVSVVEKNANNGSNNHPTVKPIELMKYLIKLITPPGGIVLDPFNGSGSTGCAAVELGYEYIGCELDPKYVDITNKRIAAWLKQSDPLKASGLFEVKE
jgi:site-specific DNA-methyltransferase (adenine-specific)